VNIASESKLEKNGAKPLFRREVVEAKRKQLTGEILLTRPLSLAVITALSLLIAVSLIILLFFGNYTRRERVTGRVAVAEGIAKIYAPVSGVVVRKLVQEGDLIKKGQALYLISVERVTSQGNTQIALGQEIQRRRENLQKELELKKTASQLNILVLKRKISDLETQLENVKSEIAIQTKHLKLSEAAVQRFRDLLNTKFVSEAQVEEHEQDRLDQMARLQTLQRTALTIETDLASSRAALQTAPLDVMGQVSVIERGISEAAQESIENEARREIAVTALEDGRATAVLVEAGQTVSPSTQMLSVVPQKSKMEVYLYVPSRAIGFIREGEKVQLRYSAFPYQKFGQYTGVVKNVSLLALSPNELQMFGSASETFFRVIVSLDQQCVLAYGKEIRLQDGMQVDADVMLDTRRLYEWLLEPLFSITGKM
jgi:membrane fusion protein